MHEQHHAGADSSLLLLLRARWPEPDSDPKNNMNLSRDLPCRHKPPPCQKKTRSLQVGNQSFKRRATYVRHLEPKNHHVQTCHHANMQFMLCHTSLIPKNKNIHALIDCIAKLVLKYAREHLVVCKHFFVNTCRHINPVVHAERQLYKTNPDKTLAWPSNSRCKTVGFCKWSNHLETYLVSASAPS